MKSQKSKVEKKSKVKSQKSKVQDPSIFELWVWRWIAPAAAMIGAFAASPLTYAQGCPMCYNAAAAAKAGAIQALRSGILILLIPPVLMFVGIFLIAFRNRDRFNDQSAPEFDYDEEFRRWLSPLPLGDRQTTTADHIDSGSGRYAEANRDG